MPIPKRLVILLSTLMMVLIAGLAYGQIKIPISSSSSTCLPKEFPLTYGAGGGAGTGTVVGKVIVWNDSTKLYVRYEITTPGIYLKETQVAICEEPFTNRPEPGLSPYKQEHAAGTTAYTYDDIPLTGMLLHPDCPFCSAAPSGITAAKGKPQTCSFDAQCEDTLYIAAHAALSNGETAYGGDCERPTGGAWFCQIAYTICCGAEPPPGTCDETAWGYRTGGECFINIPELKSNNWGWTNQISAPGTYTLDLYAGAAQCNLSKGTKVGTVTVVYDGSRATVTYTPNAGYSFLETHVWIGKDKLPKNKAGKYIAAPGRFPYKDGATVTITAPFWVAAHAKVGFSCGD